MCVVSMFGNDAGAFYDRLLAGRAAQGTTTASILPGSPSVSPSRSVSFPKKMLSKNFYPKLQERGKTLSSWMHLQSIKTYFERLTSPAFPPPHTTHPGVDLSNSRS